MKRHSWNIHERFLRHIWSNQYLKIPLYTTDGQLLKVVNVGRLNSDGGPDFLDAKIRIGVTTYVGDVEIHRTPFDWFQHQHQEDPRYNKVVLHVVLEAESNFLPTLAKSGRTIPVLILSRFLSESIHSIWQKAILDERVKRAQTLRCFEGNDVCTPELLDHLLSKLSVERLELKLRRIEERLKQLAHERRMTVLEHRQIYGSLSQEGNQEEIPPPLPELTQKDFSQKDLWEQVLYEGIMEGLGYSKNRDPFIRLAQSATLKKISSYRPIIQEEFIYALLFGSAGLIPKINSLKEKESREYVRRIARLWKMMKASYQSEILHVADWQFFPTRPTNFPTLRIAAAGKLIYKFLYDDVFRRIIQTFKSRAPGMQKERELYEIMNVDVGAYWKHHYHFDSPTNKNITALGIVRIREIIINAVLPLAMLYARIFRDKEVRAGALDVYSVLPATEDNSITRMMKNQLIKSRLNQKQVSHQQAIIQLYKYYCSEGRCEECDVGQKVFAE